MMCDNYRYHKTDSILLFANTMCHIAYPFCSQVITFRDYLLHIVGPDILNGPEIGPFPGYDENVDPSISNVFATAAYRFAHLAIQPFMFRLDENYRDHQKWPSVLFHVNFFTPWRLVFEGERT